MKKLWLFLSLLTCSISLTWCFKILDWDWMVNEVNEPKNCDNYTWKYLALYPFWTEVEPKEPDYSWMTVQKLYNDPDIKNDIENHRWKDIYFLNSIYYKLYRDDEWKYKSEEKIVIQEDPTKEPL